MHGVRNAAGVVCVGLLVALGQLAMPGAAFAAPRAAPASLGALEQRMGELDVTSLRYSVQTSFAFAHRQRKLARLLKDLGLDSRTSGEVTFAPSAANVSFSLFGRRFTLRSAGEVEYVEIPSLARHDDGRPWVRLGEGGLAELSGAAGQTPASAGAGADAGASAEAEAAEPLLLEPPFQALANRLAGARQIRELAPGTVGGQPVTRFLATLAASQLRSGTLASAASARAAGEPPRVTLEVSLTQSGLPVRTVIATHAAQLSETTTLEIQAVNLPLAIAAPPRAQTIGVSALRALSREAQAAERARRRRRRSRRAVAK